ncbi:MAG: hypothetical protein ACRD0M_12485, partial [Acidimicrobiales bacterium]
MAGRVRPRVGHGAGIRPHLAAALPGWVAARLAVALSFVVAHLIVTWADPGPSARRHLDEGLLGWDAAWYRDIAAHGYAGLPRVGVRFFPLLPLVTRAVAFMTGHTGVALLVVTNVAALGLGALVHRLALVERGDASLARRAATAVAVVPPAFVYVWGYSEALAGCLSVAAFLALRTQR